MKSLMAPWRMEHVVDKAARVSGCLFEPPENSPFDKDTLLPPFQKLLCDKKNNE